MAYGKIDLTAGDIAFMKDRLGCAAARIAASMTAASSTDERTFYERATVKIDQWIVAVSHYVAGPKRFDEDELLYLRGAIAETVPGALARRVVEAKRSGDASLDDPEAEYEQWVTLSAKLEKPFLDDKSQDAEPEDEDD